MSRGRAVLLPNWDRCRNLATLAASIAAARRHAGIQDVSVARFADGRLHLLSPALDEPFATTLPWLGKAFSDVRFDTLAHHGHGFAADEGALLAALLERPCFTLPIERAGDFCAALLFEDAALEPALRAAGPDVTRSWFDSTLAEKSLVPGAVLVQLPYAATKVWRILALNIDDLRLHALLGQAIGTLLERGHGVELAMLADEETAAAHHFLEDERVRLLAAETTLRSLADAPWDLVLIGTRVPPAFRAFRLLHAALVVGARPALLHAPALPVTIAPGPAGLEVVSAEQGSEAGWLLALRARGSSSLLVPNNRLIGGPFGDAIPPVPLWAQLRYLDDLAHSRNAFEVLEIAKSALFAHHQPIDIVALADGLVCRHMQVEATADGAVTIAVATVLANALAQKDTIAFCRAVFSILLHRDCELSYAVKFEDPLPFERRAEFIRNVAHSEELANKVSAAELRRLQPALDQLCEMIGRNAALFNAVICATRPSADDAHISSQLAEMSPLARLLHQLLLPEQETQRRSTPNETPSPAPEPMSEPDNTAPPLA